MSCNNNQDIRYYRIPKMDVVNSDNQKLTHSSGLEWIVPKGWVAMEKTSIRIGSYKIPWSDGTGELSIIKLAGNAGGIIPNINRWRGQLSLHTLSENEILKFIKSYDSALGPFQWLKIINHENSESAFLASIFQTKTHTIFVKLNTSISGLSILESQFLRFCKSFRNEIE